MPRMAVCPAPGCPSLIPAGTGRCPTCRARADRKRRPDGNPYRTAGHQRFREHVLTRDPICTCDDPACPAHPGRDCLTIATVADHWPTERVDLIEQGLDPNDPSRGRGLCTDCHNRKTARTKPGGWNART